jgi:hypothetical protein
MPSLPRRRRRILDAIGIALLAMTARIPIAGAAPIVWGQAGAFETCLEGSLEAWLAKQAELEVNEDPAASRLDDAAVADWTIAAMRQCRARGEPAEPQSEDRFTRHMAQWRRHVYERATEIRRKGHSD